MAQLYITENKAQVGLKDGRIYIVYSDTLTRSIPIEGLESITIIGMAQVTTACIAQCLSRGISVQYYSSKGFYYGKLSSTQHVNTQRQKSQVLLTDNEDFSLQLAKIILKAKINNQIVLLRRYKRNSFASEKVNENLRHMKILETKISMSSSLQEACGYEGNAARTYFQSLNTLLSNPSFSFKGRSRRPPKDEFNSMLSLGYSILMNEVYGSIEAKGLNPYFGFIHKDRQSHPSLASDLMEEWRAVIVDSVVMSLVNGSEIDIKHFYKDSETEGVFLTKEGLKIFIKKIEKRFETSMKYLDYLTYPLSFRKAIDMQVLQLCKAIEENNPDLYKPIILR
ncbi:MAG TPA: CRISPR-associated endonuclease Cas1 [Oscillospiraceae bacterium]|nr:CRISPR-associated endonuclease Cas1 [Oscillospiraceae bacterium]